MNIHAPSSSSLVIRFGYSFRQDALFREKIAIMALSLLPSICQSAATKYALLTDSGP